jgi:hypothetical protein
LLRAFQDDDTLLRMDSEAEARGYKMHEFGDSAFILHSGCTAHSRVSLAAANAEPRATGDLLPA